MSLTITQLSKFAVLDKVVHRKNCMTLVHNFSIPMSAEQQDMMLQQKLLAQGLIREIKLFAQRRLSPFNPIQVEGEPISQMILRERR